MTHPAFTSQSVAVITGGASGIGLAAATHFAGMNMRVVIVDRAADKLAAASETLCAAGAADVLTSAGVPNDLAEPFWNVVKDNINTLDDVVGWWALFRDGPTPLVTGEDKEFVAQAFDLLPPLPYDGNTWSAWTSAVKEATGRKGKGLFMPLRKAVTGRERGPEMADDMALMQVKPTL